MALDMDFGVKSTMNEDVKDFIMNYALGDRSISDHCEMFSNATTDLQFNFRPSGVSMICLYGKVLGAEGGALEAYISETGKITMAATDAYARVKNRMVCKEFRAMVKSVVAKSYGI